MLLTRDEMSFEFGGAQFDPVADKDMVEWILNQFLYGEMTGIQVGHWLYAAPNLAAAKFLAKQALEEMQHVDNFLRMLSMMDMQPKTAHPLVKFLSTGMMGGSWAEHVALEMAAGEGFVLVAFYAVIDTLNHQPSIDILKRAVKQEERHVEFGETQTIEALQKKPGLKRKLLGLNLVSLWAVRRLAKFMAKRLDQNHPLIKQVPAFLEHTCQCAEIRMMRMGLIDKPLKEIGFAKKSLRIIEAYGSKIPGLLLSLLKTPFRWLARLFTCSTPRLTDHYLGDPYIQNYRDVMTTHDKRRSS